MITQCGHCNVDSGGNHEWGCPCSPKTYPGPQVDDVVAALGLRIAALERQLAKVTQERDALRADLRAVLQYPLRHNMCCASLDIAHVVENDEVPPCDCGRDEALARPGVQAVVKD